jgi:hypothetical protein
MSRKWRKPRLNFPCFSASDWLARRWRSQEFHGERQESFVIARRMAAQEFSGFPGKSLYNPRTFGEIVRLSIVSHNMSGLI